MTSDKRKRRVQGACALMVLVVAGVVVFSYRSPADSSPHTQRWLTVNADPLVHQIGLVGKIEPEKTITLTAPFDGNVQDKLVELGQRVEAGQPLLRMDPALLEVQLRDALSTQLKARRTVREMQDWLNGPQVARARRTLRTTEMSLRNVERRLAESRTLYSRGIIRAMNSMSWSNRAVVSTSIWAPPRSSCNRRLTRARANTGRSPRWN